jgi:hypothetical protein
MNWHMLRRVIIGRYEAGLLTIDETAALLLLTHQCEARTKGEPECKPLRLLMPTGKRRGRPPKVTAA